MNKKEICPLCNEKIIGYPATSRKDNKTKICSSCGTREALIDFAIAQANMKGGGKGGAIKTITKERGRKKTKDITRTI